MANWQYHRNPVLFTEGGAKPVTINVATMVGRKIRTRSHITVVFHIESSLGEDHLSFTGFTNQREKGMMKCEGSRTPNAWIELRDKAVWVIPSSCSFESPNITILSLERHVKISNDLQVQDEAVEFATSKKLSLKHH